MHPPPETLAVADAMKTAPYTVASDTPLDEVVRAMAAQHVDVAVVLEGGRIVGVFTSADAMRILADILDGKLELGSDRMRVTSSLPRRPTRSRPAR